MKKQSNKNILIATGIYPPDIGGPATYTKELGEELPKRGFGVQIITYGNETKEEQSGDCSVFYINKNVPLLKRYFTYAKKIYILRKTFDVIYVQDPVSSGVPVFFASLLSGKPYILKVVGDYAWEQGTQRFRVVDTKDEFQHKKYGFAVELMRFVQKHVARKAKKIIVPSNYLKNIVSCWIKDRAKIVVIYNALKENRMQKTRKDIRKENDFSGFVLLSVARLVPWKGFLVLLDIFAQLRKKYPDIQLYIVGEGPEKVVIEKKIHELGLEDSVTLLGRLPHIEVLEYLQASDLFVLNTAYEGLSHLLLEATMMHCPILTTDVGGNPEAVEEGINGMLVEYNNTEELAGKIEGVYKNGFSINKQKVETLLQKFNKQKTLDLLVSEFTHI
ncbi:MAG: hypothetical protein CL685_03905 [Candidatus Magasanikbacteria bacterium]|nr:hypothetical protein [Candidatus Magasanikbacteria bacterium]|tara:strand:+ start:462 stop:1625 length:1164 start_codon:yes stop_codon:yes gene_type:complete